MLHYTDQTGRTISLLETPKRIVSIVPSQSEFLWELGLRNELAGITKFCIHPAELYNSTTRVGGTKALHLEKIRALKPDLIIGNKEENERAQIEQLQQEFNVWMSDIYSLDDAVAMMEQLGRICGKEEAALSITRSVKLSFNTVKNSFMKQSVAYFIWNDPYMVAAGNTFIDHVLQHLGFRNVFAHLSRYPIVTVEDLLELQPEFCFLSSEPYPFKDQHQEVLQKILPGSRIIIVDGELFSWYGNRLSLLEQYIGKLKQQLNGQAFKR